MNINSVSNNREINISLNQDDEIFIKKNTISTYDIGPNQRELTPFKNLHINLEHIRGTAKLIILLPFDLYFEEINITKNKPVYLKSRSSILFFTSKIKVDLKLEKSLTLEGITCFKIHGEGKIGLILPYTTKTIKIEENSHNNFIMPSTILMFEDGLKFNKVRKGMLNSANLLRVSGQGQLILKNPPFKKTIDQINSESDSHISRALDIMEEVPLFGDFLAVLRKTTKFFG